ncbi:MAG TPA: MFS transporter, partial [Polyangiales bacterium]|nr:MFS transporter [Polyangiales bacterium]
MATGPVTPQTPEQRRQAFAWALYDWGNSAFATTVMAGFFPLFFKKYWSAGADVAHSTWNLGVANSIASLIVAFVAPVLGAHADQSHGKKRWLGVFAAIGCIGTFALAFVGQGQFAQATLWYSVASLGFSASLVFYDALLVSVADDAHSDRVSALGYGLGYLGGGVLFAVNVLMYLKPALFGLADGPAGIRASFATVAVWWALFTIPLLKRVQERAAATSLADGATQRSALARALGETRKTLGRLRDMPALRNFLIAYWLYIDGIDTIQRMAVDYGLSIGLPSQSLIIALLIVQFVGFPAAIVFGKLAGRIGAKRAILIGVAAYVVITVLGYGMQTTRDFYALAVMVGLVQGGVQA